MSIRRAVGWGFGWTIGRFLAKALGVVAFFVVVSLLGMCDEPPAKAKPSKPAVHKSK